MEKEAGKHAGMDAEIRQERGIYAVYAGGKHYASCDSYREAQEELAEIRKAPHAGTETPGAQKINQLQYTGTQGKLQGEKRRTQWQGFTKSCRR